METVKIDRLTTGYVTRKGSIQITKNITASLNSGELTCLLGPNGAGKSTLLRTLAGFLPPLDGEIWIDGKKLNEYSNLELAKKVGVVLTQHIDASQVTVEQLVSLGRSPYSGFWGKLYKEDNEIVDRALEQTGVTKLRDRLVYTLSDGERQKVMIAKALAQQTPCIYLDEPTAFLDFPSKVETLLLLKRLARTQNLTVFQSTHDVNMALKLADRIWLIDRELGIKIGTPAELAEAGELQKYFKCPGLNYNSSTGLFDIVS